MGTLAVDPRRNPQKFATKTKKIKKPRVPWSNPGCFFVRDRTVAGQIKTDADSRKTYTLPWDGGGAMPLKVGPENNA